MRNSSLLGAALLLAALSVPARAGLTVAPGHSSVDGKSVGAYTADWWNWAASIPAPGPIADTTGTEATLKQSGPIFFVAGTSSGVGPVERSFDVPQGKYLLFPLVNWIVANGPDPGFPDTKTEAISLATHTINPANLFATLDGKSVTNLASHRESSGVLFTLNAADGNALFPAGSYTDAYADGYWLVVQPPAPGQHTLHFGGTTTRFVGPDGQFTVDQLTIDTTAHINVTAARPVPLPPALFPAIGTLAAAGVAGCWKRSRRHRLV